MSNVPICRLKNGLKIRRIINGMWQVSGSHGTIDVERAVDEMFSYHDSGLTTFDMADIYGPAERIFAKFLLQFKAKRGNKAAEHIQALTKWVPQPGIMTKKIVETSIDKSLKRMGVDKLDMLQFHWWDFKDQRYLDALVHLSELKNKGVIGELSVTNFNTTHLREVVKLGIDISSNQIQYSIIDNRASVQMSEFCETYGIGLLTYGTVAGGFLSEKYLNAKEPRADDLPTASLKKYKQMIDAWGGWSLFQELLRELSKIAKAQGPDIRIANVATRYILDKPVVASVIIGCRFGIPGAEHIADNLRTLYLELQPTELEDLHHILKRGRDLFKSTGDCGDEYQY
ncbi:hypothetical protein QZH41_020543 [Actinostola sp. cb2023]|nr:hypothetical protein QZH41_020543 [Actinostola sp. cb2023]